MCQQAMETVRTYKYLNAIKYQEIAMEEIKMRELCVSNRERRGVVGLNPLLTNLILRTHLDFPC